MPLYMLAADHRGWLLRALTEALPARSHDVHLLAKRVKQLGYAAVAMAVHEGVPREHAAILIDEELGAEVAVEAKHAGLTVAVPVERADQEVFECQYGDSWMEHVTHTNPDLPKVLIRHNPGADRRSLDEQLRRVRRVSNVLHDAGRPLMLELLVPPTPSQLASLDGDERAFDQAMRPELTVGAVHEIVQAGIRVAVWKVEGMPTPGQAADLARACTAIDKGRCLVLGRNAAWGDLEGWLVNAARAGGYDGFAIGRTLWWQTALGLLAGSLQWDGAVSSVMLNYRRAIQIYESAAAEQGVTGGQGGTSLG